MDAQSAGAHIARILRASHADLVRTSRISRTYLARTSHASTTHRDEIRARGVDVALPELENAQIRVGLCVVRVDRDGDLECLTNSRKWRRVHGRIGTKIKVVMVTNTQQKKASLTQCKRRRMRREKGGLTGQEGEGG
eukprot:5975866-Pleurochrysis_carterae.AAC.4